MNSFYTLTAFILLCLTIFSPFKAWGVNKFETCTNIKNYGVSDKPVRVHLKKQFTKNAVLHTGDLPSIIGWSKDGKYFAYILRHDVGECDASLIFNIKSHNKIIHKIILYDADKACMKNAMDLEQKKMPQQIIKANKLLNKYRISTPKYNGDCGGSLNCILPADCQLKISYEDEKLSLFNKKSNKWQHLHSAIIVEDKSTRMKLKEYFQSPFVYCPIISEISISKNLLAVEVVYFSFSPDGFDIDDQYLLFKLPPACAHLVRSNLDEK